MLSGFFCYHLKHIQFSNISQFPVCAFMYGTFALGNRNTYTARKRVTVVVVFCVTLSGYVIFFPGMLYDVSKVHYLRHDDRFFADENLLFYCHHQTKSFFSITYFLSLVDRFTPLFSFTHFFVTVYLSTSFPILNATFFSFLFCFFPFAPRCVCVCCLVCVRLKKLCDSKCFFLLKTPLSKKS